MSAIPKENSEQKNKSLFSLALRCYQPSLFGLFSFVDTFNWLKQNKTKKKKQVSLNFFFFHYISRLFLWIYDKASEPGA